MPPIKYPIALLFLFLTSIASAFTENCPPIKPDCDAFQEPITRVSEKQAHIALKTIN
ncbi:MULTISPECIES: hypothetical protein [Proteus]|jgi:hypothetical protein|uniref:hypothetical protein n=1 Tax=Proteus TaxID=583 RepID=UPI000500480B|nr:MULTISPECIES: hypothetical protein [Proteus]NBN60952.1 hypothetical protein [Proteus sp. G2639]KGA60298.1 hypothetical protein DR95_912 [Proteus vulgaris]MBG5971912.1 hypothetical protein [Proteus vulgaris]MBI6510220.1 hypothetical protein [Proteus sp. PR00174]MBW3472134.1 hypothetical protein [Proteus vulgaris]